MDSFTQKKIEFDAVRRILGGFCSTSPGKILARRVTPSRSPDVVRRRLAETDEMVQAVRDVGTVPLGGVTDIASPLARAKPGGGATGEDYAQIASAIEGAGNVKKYLLSLPKRLTLLIEMVGEMEDFSAELNAIGATLESDGTIRDDASKKLSDIRKRISSAGEQIQELIRGYLKAPQVAKLLQDTVITLHGDRYVLPVKRENRGRLDGVVHRESNSGATVFVEPAQCVELNNKLTDLHEDERREIQRLLSRLGMIISPRANAISTTMRHVAQIDLLSAKAQYAYKFDMTCPNVSERGYLEFHEMRHPILIEQEDQQAQAGVAAADRHKAVPIDIRLGRDFDLLVITGSNTGGKTVAIKTVGLCVLMAQAGMHIPVRRGGVMPIFRDVFLDVGDEQSLEQSLSTFGAHVKRLKYIFSHADRSSLILLDELGAGTDPEEGGAIGQAILDEMRKIGCLGMVTTHLSVLKAYAYNHERVDNGSVEFDTSTLRPTFRLLIGSPGQSHAIAVAGSLGFSKRMIIAAERHLAAQGKQFRKAIKTASAARELAEEAKTQANNAQLESQTLSETYQSKLADLHSLQEDFRTWLARLPDLKPSDEVFVPSLNKTATLVRLELHKQIALVETSNKQVEVPISELMPNLGQEQIREEISTLRKQILQQAEQAEQVKADAERVRKEYHKSLTQQRQRAKQFDTWLACIARLKIGKEVPINMKPGMGKVTKVDLPGLRVTVEIEGKEKTLPLQDIFPQTGPFAPPDRVEHRKGRKRPPTQRGGKPQKPDKPMTRTNPNSKVAKIGREKLLAAEPGQKVFVVPFNKTATLIRMNGDKSQAVVLAGAFEMTIPVADLKPIEK